MNADGGGCARVEVISMGELSLHGFDNELKNRLTEIARREGVSLNEAALRLLRRGAGLPDSGPPAPAIGNALDEFVGRWSEADEAALLQSIAACETVDEALWK
jgi:hypothetical protein